MAETLFKELGVGETFCFLSPRLPDGIFRKTSARDAQHTDYDYVSARPSGRAHVLRIDLEESEEGDAPAGALNGSHRGAHPTPPGLN